MPKLNLFVMLLTALIPLATGFIWYSKMLFNNAWMASAKLTEDDMKKGNMALVFLLTYVLGFILTVPISLIVIHQFGVTSIFQQTPGAQDPSTPVGAYIVDFMNKYGNNFRTFKHGAFHGTITGFTLVMPVVAIIALFEKRSFKYVAIHTGYWMLTLALMGGVLCQWCK